MSGNFATHKKYSEIYDYWNRVKCDGGFAGYPFFLYSKRKVLEIGYGSGNDARRFLYARADYTGIDLIDPPIKSCWFRKMNAEDIDYPDNYFDHVYSFGVIHHAVNPDIIIDEIYRVLQPGGTFFIMLYNKPSVRYNLDIMFLRKILWAVGYHRYKFLKKSCPNPTHKQWVSWNTDNLGCPLSRVYTKDEAERMFNRFRDVKSKTINWGWFRLVTGKK